MRKVRNAERDKTETSFTAYYLPLDARLTATRVAPQKARLPLFRPASAEVPYVRAAHRKTLIPTRRYNTELCTHAEFPVKTTLDIDDTLITQAKTLAAQQRTTLTRLIEGGLVLRLRAQQKPSRKKTILPVYQGKGGLAAGVDGLSNKAMLEIADRDA